MTKIQVAILMMATASLSCSQIQKKNQNNDDHRNGDQREVASMSPQVALGVACIRNTAPLSSAVNLRFPMGLKGHFVAFGMENTDGTGKKGTFFVSESETIFVSDDQSLAGSGEFPPPLYEVRMPDQSVLYLALAFWDVISVYQKSTLLAASLPDLETAKKRILYSYVEKFQPSEYGARGLRRPSFSTVMKNSLATTLTFLEKMDIKNPPLYLTGETVSAGSAFFDQFLIKWIKDFISGVTTRYKNELYSAYQPSGSQQDPDVGPYLELIESSECREIQNEEVRAMTSYALKRLSPEGIDKMKMELGLAAK